jgi:hypothetical protein
MNNDNFLTTIPHSACPPARKRIAARLVQIMIARSIKAEIKKQYLYAQTLLNLGRRGGNCSKSSSRMPYILSGSISVAEPEPHHFDGSKAVIRCVSD